MRRAVSVWCVGLFVAATGRAVEAQVVLGSVRGQVRDQAGAAAAGVMIAASSEALLQPISEETGPTGRYRLVSLPPGEYEVVFTAPAWPRHVQRVRMAPGDTLELDVVLGAPAPEAGVGPRNESPSTGSYAYDRGWVELAPIRRSSVFDLLNMAPGVSASTTTDDRAQVFGSSTNENRYFLDGNDITAPQSGVAIVRPNPDAVEAVQVLALGAPVEYGAVPGAVFNVLTRQGGATWRAGASYYAQPPGLTGRNTTSDQDADRPFDRVAFHDVTARVGGPLMRDRLWLFGALQAQTDEYSLPGEDPAFPTRTTAQNILLKVNGRLGRSSRFQAQYQGDSFNVPEPGSALIDPSARAKRHGHTPAPSGAYWASLAGVLIEARAGGFYGRDRSDPEDGGPRVSRRFTEFVTGRTTGGIAQWSEGTSSRTTVSFRATKPVNGIGIGHDVSLGVQYSSGGSDYLIGNNDDIATANNRPVFGYTQAPHHRGGRAEELGLYVGDAWRVSRRLSVSGGVRYDRNTASFEALPLLDRRGGAAGTSMAVSPVFDWTVVSPRVGAVLSLDAAGRSVVRGHVGRYYRGIVTNEFDVATPAIASRYWFNGTYDRNDIPNQLDLVDSVSRLGIDPDLRNPYIDQAGVAFEQQLVGANRLSISFVSKRGRDHTGWRDAGGLYRTISRDVQGTIYQLSQLVSGGASQRFLLTNPDGMSTDYRGVTVAWDHRQGGTIFLRAAATYSKSTGQLASSSARVSPSVPQLSTAEYVDGMGFGQNPNDFINADGVLSGDRPLVFKTQATVAGPWRLSVGVHAQYQSGRPWGREVRVVGLGVGTRLLLEPLDNDRRVDDVALIDVRVRKSLGVGARGTVELFTDVLNLLNSGAAEDFRGREPGRPGFELPSRVVWPRRTIVGARVSF